MCVVVTDTDVIGVVVVTYLVCFVDVITCVVVVSVITVVGVTVFGYIGVFVVNDAARIVEVVGVDVVFVDVCWFCCCCGW